MFIFYYYNKNNKVIIKLINLVFNYIIKVIISLKNIIRIIKCDFNNKYKFRNSI